MPELTRRRSLDAPDECWHVYYGDVRVGTIAIRIGIPPHEDPWGWACCSIPVAILGNAQTAPRQRSTWSRADFEQTWRASGLPWLEATFRTSNTVAAWGNIITRLPKAEQRTKYSRRPWRH